MSMNQSIIDSKPKFEKLESGIGLEKAPEQRSLQAKDFSEQEKFIKLLFGDNSTTAEKKGDPTSPIAENKVEVSKFEAETLKKINKESNKENENPVIEDLKENYLIEENTSKFFLEEKNLLKENYFGILNPLSAKKCSSASKILDNLEISLNNSPPSPSSLTSQDSKANLVRLAANYSRLAEVLQSFIQDGQCPNKILETCNEWLLLCLFHLIEGDEDPLAHQGCAELEQELTKEKKESRLLVNKLDQIKSLAEVQEEEIEKLESELCETLTINLKQKKLIEIREAEADKILKTLDKVAEENHQMKIILGKEEETKKEMQIKIKELEQLITESNLKTEINSEKIKLQNNELKELHLKLLLKKAEKKLKKTGIDLLIRLYNEEIKGSKTLIKRGNYGLHDIDFLLKNFFDFSNKNFPIEKITSTNSYENFTKIFDGVAEKIYYSQNSNRKFSDLQKKLQAQICQIEDYFDIELDLSSKNFKNLMDDQKTSLKKKETDLDSCTYFSWTKDCLKSLLAKKENIFSSNLSSEFAELSLKNPKLRKKLQKVLYSLHMMKILLLQYEIFSKMKIKKLAYKIVAKEDFSFKKELFESYFDFFPLKLTTEIYEETELPKLELEIPEKKISATKAAAFKKLENQLKTFDQLVSISVPSSKMIQESNLKVLIQLGKEIRIALKHIEESKLKSFENLICFCEASKFGPITL